MKLVVVAAVKVTLCAYAVQWRDCSNKVSSSPIDGQRRVVELLGLYILLKTKRTSVTALDTEFDGNYMTVRVGNNSIDACY